MPRVMTDASLEPPLQPVTFAHRIAAEALGTAMLLAIVVGSGVMAERLAGGNTAIALLGNTLATGAGLVVLITIFGPLSGAHFNPAVTLVFALRREIGALAAGAYVAAQVLGGIIGVWAAHLMFAEPLLQVSLKLRDGPAQAFSEGVATFGPSAQAARAGASTRGRKMTRRMAHYLEENQSVGSAGRSIEACASPAKAQLAASTRFCPRKGPQSRL